MLVDLRKHAPAAISDCDIAIVGTVAAGLSLTRVHADANLYVAGSSVFPTADWAGPTLTILTLTHRLGDHRHARWA